ncbi:Necrosis inducing protein [Phytophthora cactorum]|nr:Necrosis inducing protein [Phytophthora cactorum]
MMFAWYFPKGFWAGMASRRHDWASVVVWIDNSALEPAKILGVSLSKSTGHYSTDTGPLYERYFAGFQVLGRRGNRTYVQGSNTSIRVTHSTMLPLSSAYLGFTTRLPGPHHVEQLTEEARVALNATDFGKSKVPFNDDNFENTLEKAWPF